MKHLKALAASLLLASVGVGMLGTAATTTATAAAKKYDEEIVQTYQSSSSIVNEATVVCDGYDSATLYSVNRDTVKPSNVIMYLNEDMNIVDRSGEVIDSFEYVYEELDHTLSGYCSVFFGRLSVRRWGYLYVFGGRKRADGRSP